MIPAGDDASMTLDEVVENLNAGHYATETFGVKALGRHIEEAYGLPWTFIDHPTGL